MACAGDFEGVCGRLRRRTPLRWQSAAWTAGRVEMLEEAAVAGEVKKCADAVRERGEKS